MIEKNIMRVTGGLGNQLSEYAFIFNAAKQKGVPFGLDTSSYVTECLKGRRVQNDFELTRIFGIEARASLREWLHAGALSYYSCVARRKLLGTPIAPKSPVCVEVPEHGRTYHAEYINSQYRYYHGFFCPLPLLPATLAFAARPAGVSRIQQ